MKIFEIAPRGGYKGGCMIVNANNENEAWDLAMKENRLLEWEDKTDYRIQEILGLTYAVDEPCVIVSALYFE